MVATGVVTSPQPSVRFPLGRSRRRTSRAGSGGLLASGLKPTTAARKLATFRSLLDFAKEDQRVSVNNAREVKAPTAGRTRREGQYLTVAEVDALVAVCTGPYAELVKVLALGGMRWGELAGLQVRDRVTVPGAGLRLQRAVLANSDTGRLYEETLKGHRARTVGSGPGADHRSLVRGEEAR